jgi:hypothetical protein
MAVEITNESSDMFLPLKAVVGAISVLMKNYEVSVCRSRIECFLIPLPTQQTSDNAEGVKEIERRVNSLSGVLASPASEDDYAEKGRRVELRRFVLARTFISLLTPPRKLDGVIAKLEPLSDQHALTGFFRNAENAKTLTGFVQELANAITDYQVRTAGPAAIFDERPARFQYNKECTRGRGKSTMKPRTSTMKPRTSTTRPRTSTMIPRTSW